MAAAVKGNLAVVEALLNRGADLTLENVVSVLFFFDHMFETSLRMDGQRLPSPPIRTFPAEIL